MLKGSSPKKGEVSLTPRERMVLDEYVLGKSDREIARDLGRSVHTIRTIARNIRARVGVSRMKDIIAGVQRGDYKIRPSEQRFNLESAVAALTRGLLEMQERQDRSPRGNQRVVVRLHELEVEALITLSRASLDSERHDMRGPEQL